MPTAFLAFVAAALATLAGREAMRVAQLSAALGGSKALLAACWLATLVACFLAASAGAALAAEVPFATWTIVEALALAATAAALLGLRPAAAPAEPTRSFGAIVLVLAMAQLGAGPGLLVFALAGGCGATLPAAGGAALGIAAVQSAAWRLGARWETRLPLGLLRHGVSALLLLASAIVGLAAFARA